MRRFLWMGLGVALAATVGAAVWPREHREVTTKSKAAYTLYEQGNDLFDRYQWEAAKDKFNQAIAADSTFAMAYLGLAKSYTNLHWRNEAKAAVAKAMVFSDHCTQREQLLIAYDAARAKPDSAAAESTLDMLRKEFPDDPETLMLSGTAEWSAYNMARTDSAAAQRAIADFNRVLKLDPTRVGVHNMLGYLEATRGNFDEAIAHLKRYAYYCPDQPNPHDSLAEIYLMAGRYDEAASEYLQALRIDPSFWNSALQLASVLSTTGQFSQAHQVLATAKQIFVRLRQEPRWEWADISVDLDAKRYAEVLRRTDALLPFPAEPDPSFPELEGRVYSARAYCQMELGKFDAAEASLDANDEFWKSLADRFGKMMSENSKAEVALGSKLLRARLLACRGETEQASKMVDTAMADTNVPGSRKPSYYIAIGEVQLRVGAYAQAVASERLALAEVPTRPNANRVLGTALAKLGDTQGALSALGVYLHVMRTADPGNADVDAARALYEQLNASS